MAALTGVGGLSNENPDPVDVANFLLRTKGLDKAAVGELLGGHDDESVAVMRAFARSFDFSKLDFDVALRVFLKPFRLPGEAKRLEEHAQRDVEIEFRKIKRPRERAHDGDGFVVVPAEEFADRRLVEPFRSKEEVRDIDRVGVLVR